MTKEEQSLPVALPLPLPDVDRMGDVVVLFEKASLAWGEDNIEEFVALLAQAFSLDIHDFHQVMDEYNQTRRACAAVDVLEDRGADTPEFHVLKIAMALVDTEGFFFKNGAGYTDLSRNYVLAKWTRAVPTTLRLLVRLKSEGSIASLPELEYWKILSLFGADVSCLGNVKLSTKIYKKVKVLAVSASADFAALTEIERDISGLESNPANTCCVCMDARNAAPCGRCGISCYCSKRCQAADWKWNHKDVCGSMIGWKDIVYSKV
jgi:hypothetical protein